MALVRSCKWSILWTCSLDQVDSVFQNKYCPNSKCLKVRGLALYSSDPSKYFKSLGLSPELCQRSFWIQRIEIIFSRDLAKKYGSKYSPNLTKKFKKWLRDLVQNVVQNVGSKFRHKFWFKFWPEIMAKNLTKIPWIQFGPKI